MAKIRIDGTRIQTVRTIVLAAFAAVAVVLLGALGLRKLAMHGVHFDLPGRLGVNISQTADGFTYSQSQGGHTIFTIHAARIVEFKANQAELHDVQITLYGPPGSHRKDSIQGADFLYNRETGVVIAKGAVRIDMAPPSTTASTTSQSQPDTVHIETSGLRFNQKTGDAQTDQPLSFILPRANGKAIGGDYNSKTGVLVLQSAVELVITQNDTHAIVHATHAQLLRDAHVAYLLNASDTYEGSQSSSDQAILHFRPDGTLLHLDAQDHVHAVTADGAQLYSSTASADFDPQSQPMRVTAGGGVNFASTAGDSNMHGNAIEGTMLFVKGTDGKATLHHAQFRNAVSFVMQQNSLGGDPRGSATREITASTVDINFVPGPGGKGIAKDALARGGARVNLHDLPYGGTPRHTTISGQQLLAQLSGGRQLHQVDGSGGTSVVHYQQDGSTDTSNGDTLHAIFLPVARAAEVPQAKPGHPTADGNESAQLDNAQQQGHVTLVAMPGRFSKPAGNRPQQPLYGSGTLLTYNGQAGMLELTGAPNLPPQVHNDTFSMTATRIDYNRDTSDAAGFGDVRGTVLRQNAQGENPARAAVPAHSQPLALGGSGPVHVVADHGTLARASDTATFYGSAAAPAKLWQDSDSVSAPVLVLNRTKSTLDASGSDASVDPVHTVFVQKAAGEKASTAFLPVRIASQTLTYSDLTRIGNFRGHVIAEQPHGTVHSDEAEVVLTRPPAQGQPAATTAASTPASTPAPAATPATTKGSLDRLTATGHVELTQPGRRGAGDKLVYTASDGNYVLTGTPGAPPHAFDAEHGETTGEALLFRSGDNSVEVMGEAKAHRRAVVDTRTTK